ncbi:hypothetical protein BJX61DRAFT_512155 [Aspergillus egyptiacus]|nr:hypothetical protein BJX61DRAFT_512155 [Aspergillus egyptiacus]
MVITTPFWYATGCGNSDTAQLLITHGADLNMTNERYNIHTSTTLQLDTPSNAAPKSNPSRCAECRMRFLRV